MVREIKSYKPECLDLHREEYKFRTGKIIEMIGEPIEDYMAYLMSEDDCILSKRYVEKYDDGTLSDDEMSNGFNLLWNYFEKAYLFFRENLIIDIEKNPEMISQMDIIIDGNLRYPGKTKFKLIEVVYNYNTHKGRNDIDWDSYIFWVPEDLELSKNKSLYGRPDKLYEIFEFTVVDSDCDMTCCSYKPEVGYTLANKKESLQ